MTLHNYWLLLVWIGAGGAVLGRVFPRREERAPTGGTEPRWQWLPALMLIIPLVVWAGFRADGFGDTAAYRNAFRAAPTGLSALVPYVTAQSKDWGYAALVVLFKTLVSRSDAAFFLTVAAVQLLCLAATWRRCSRDYLFSVFLFVASTDYVAWMYNGMRQFIAASLIFACLPLLVRRRYVPAVLVVLLASLFHGTALLFLPFVFIVPGRAWNPLTLLFLAAVAAAVFFLDTFTGLLTAVMEETVYAPDVADLVNDDGTNLLRVLFYSVPAVMSLVFRRRVERANDPLVNVCVNLSVVTAGFYVISHFTSGILIGRIPIYFSLSNYILLPWLLTEVFTPASARELKAVCAGAYILFFYFQMGVTWGLL